MLFNLCVYALVTVGETQTPTSTQSAPAPSGIRKARSQQTATRLFLPPLRGALPGPDFNILERHIRSYKVRRELAWLGRIFREVMCASLSAVYIDFHSEPVATYKFTMNWMVRGIVHDSPAGS
jgi:hypothetical protein